MLWGVGDGEMVVVWRYVSVADYALRLFYVPSWLRFTTALSYHRTPREEHHTEQHTHHIHIHHANDVDANLRSSRKTRH